MGRDVSIVISAKDNFSQAITTMRNSNQAFNKDLTGLSAKLDALNRTKVTLKVDTDKAKTALKEAEKQFAATGSAADKMALELANEDYENARRNLGLVSSEAKQTEKNILSMTNAISKADNRAQTAGGGGGLFGGLAGSLASAGMTKLIGDSLSGAASAWAGSSLGDAGATMFDSVLSSAATGAAIGSLVPGVGTAVGAAVGGAVGLVNGAVSNFEKKDDAFQSYVEDQYNSIQEDWSNSLERGSGIASKREQTRISFSTLLGGADAADEYLSQMKDFASATPFDYDTLAAISKTLLAYGYKQEELLPLLTKVGDAGSALSMSTQDMTYIATSLGRMETTGKTTLEYLNPLLERGIPVWEYMAKAFNVSESKAQEMVSKGLIPGQKAAEAIADAMGQDFSGSMDLQSQTFGGLTSTLEDAQNELDAAMGRGFNETRKPALQEQVDWLTGESGEEMQGVYEKMGAWQASMKGRAEQYERDAYDSVMKGDTNNDFSAEAKLRLDSYRTEYERLQQEINEATASGDKEKAEELGAQQGYVLAEAKALAQDEYNASEGAQLLLQSNKTLAENIRNDAGLQSEYWDAGYVMGVQFSTGMAAAVAANNPVTPLVMGGGKGYGTKNKSESDEKNQYDVGAGSIQNKSVIKPMVIGGGHAYGLRHVPYDDFPAMLHEGERVLTASEARTLENSAPSVTVTGNSFTVREEADIEKIGRAIVANIVREIHLTP